MYFQDSLARRLIPPARGRNTGKLVVLLCSKNILASEGPNSSPSFAFYLWCDLSHITFPVWISDSPSAKWEKKYIPLINHSKFQIKLMYGKWLCKLLNPTKVNEWLFFFHIWKKPLNEWSLAWVSIYVSPLRSYGVALKWRKCDCQV